MNWNLKPHPFLAHFIPGCFAVSIITLAHYGWSIAELNRAAGVLSNCTLLAIVVGILILGECIDAVRDAFEHVLDKNKDWKIDWGHALAQEKTEGDLYVFENYYFTYYVFCANSVVVVLVAIIGCQIDRLPTLKLKALTALVLMTLTFFVDAVLLRVELVGKDWIKKKSTHGE